MKYLKYASYVIRHKWFVLLACIKNSKQLPAHLALYLVFRALIHDWSKLLPSEWFPYMEFFYNNPKKEEREQALKVLGHDPYPLPSKLKWDFNVAWNKHQKRNKHHWQYWVLLPDTAAPIALQIPTIYVYEMVSDWQGAGRAIHRKNDPNECRQWYLKNRESMLLNPYTQVEVEKLLGIF